MHTIAVVNEKGGTGKTTTAVNLAAALGAIGHKVLLVDLDGQAASSRWLGVEEDSSFADALYSGKGLHPLKDVMPNVSLAPACGKLDAVAHDLRPTQGGQLKKLLQEAACDYEYCIIDCPPSLGNRLIGNALLASSHAIVPVETSILALDGLKILLTTLDDIREGFDHNIGLAGVLACRFDARTRLSHMVLAELKRALPGKVFDTVIRENVRMRECPASGKSILDYAPDSHAAEDYRALAAELVASGRLAATHEADYLADKAAFQAADDTMRFGDMLRQSVRKPTAAADENAPARQDEDWKSRLEEAQRRLVGEEPAANAIESQPAPADAPQAPASTDQQQVPALAPAADSGAIESSPPAAAQPAQPVETTVSSETRVAEPSPVAAAQTHQASDANQAPGWESWFTNDQSTLAARNPEPPAIASPAEALAVTLSAPVGDVKPADTPAAAMPVTPAVTAEATQPPAPAKQDAAAAAAPQPVPLTPLEPLGAPDAWEEPAAPAENVDADCPNLRRMLETMDWDKIDSHPTNDVKQPDKRGLLRRFLGK